MQPARFARVTHGAKVLLLLVSGLLAGPLAAQAPLEQWPQWRGPLANGVALHGDPPLQWDATSSVKWKTPIPGKGSATPIVWGERVFILSATDTGKEAAAADLPKIDPKFETKTQPPKTFHQYLVLCLDRNSGKVLWQQVATEQVPHEGVHSTHSYAAGSPVTDGKHVWFSFGSRGVFCYTVDGQKVWERDLGDMHTRFGWGEASTPVLFGDALAVNWDHEGASFLVVLDPRTGQVKWKKDREEPTSWSTPLVVEHQGRPQLIVNATNKIRGYDLILQRHV